MNDLNELNDSMYEVVDCSTENGTKRIAIMENISGQDVMIV